VWESLPFPICVVVFERLLHLKLVCQSESLDLIKVVVSDTNEVLGLSDEHMTKWSQ